MLIDNEWVCTTQMIQAFIPDYRRRLCDLKKDGYILTGRPCQQHQHQSKILKEWHLIEKPEVILPIHEVKSVQEIADFLKPIQLQPNLF